VYVSTRVMLIGVAVGVALITGHPLASTVGHWDGVWYSRLALGGYPDHPVHDPSVLGFFPLFPLAMWAVMHAFGASAVVAGALISGVGGLVATVLVQKLATGWWGAETGRRTTVLFCLFPGSVVFSMVYSEGLLIPLAVGCLLALQHRRWLLAGVLAGIATATAATGVALIIACVVAAFRSKERRALVAPLLSLTGIAAFAAFLWGWTGTPFASLIAQRDGWHERLDPIAIVHQGQLLESQLAKLSFPHPVLDLNPLAALLGTVVLIVGVALLLRQPRRVSVEAFVWTVAVGALALFSEHVGPNARMLITAFPAVIVFAHRIRGRAYGALLGVNAVLLVLMSALTFTGHSLTP
jgi:Gpi18-like mannosyltransferase